MCPIDERDFKACSSCDKLINYVLMVGPHCKSCAEKWDDLENSGLNAIDISEFRAVPWDGAESTVCHVSNKGIKCDLLELIDDVGFAVSVMSQTSPVKYYTFTTEAEALHFILESLTNYTFVDEPLNETE